MASRNRAPENGFASTLRVTHGAMRAIDRTFFSDCFTHMTRRRPLRPRTGGRSGAVARLGVTASWRCASDRIFDLCAAAGIHSCSGTRFQHTGKALRSPQPAARSEHGHGGNQRRTFQELQVSNCHVLPSMLPPGGGHLETARGRRDEVAAHCAAAADSSSRPRPSIACAPRRGRSCLRRPNFSAS